MTDQSLIMTVVDDAIHLSYVSGGKESSGWYLRLSDVPDLLSYIKRWKPRDYEEIMQQIGDKNVRRSVL